METLKLVVKTILMSQIFALVIISLAMIAGNVKAGSQSQVVASSYTQSLN